MLILAQNDGTVVYKSRAFSRVSGEKIPFPNYRAYMEAEARGHNVAELLAYEITDEVQMESLSGYLPEQLLATVESGAVIGVQPKPTAPNIWLHGSISGGTVNTLTGTRYLERGDTLTYTAQLRETSDPGSAEVTDVPGSDPLEPLSGSWALECIHELGIDQFSPMVTMTAGVISGSVIVPDRLRDGLYRLPEERMAMLAGIKLRLTDPTAFEFKVRS